MPDPGLDLWRQDVQELLQHEELQNLFLGVQLGLQPLTAELLEPGEGLLGSRHLLITKPSKALAGELRIGAVFLQSGSPFVFQFCYYVSLWLGGSLNVGLRAQSYLHLSRHLGARETGSLLRSSSSLRAHGSAQVSLNVSKMWGRAGHTQAPSSRGQHRD